MSPAAFPDLLYSLFKCHLLFITPIRGHGIKTVGEDQDAGKIIDLVTLQSVGIAFAVPSFAVVPDDFDLFIKKFDG